MDNAELDMNLQTPQRKSKRLAELEVAAGATNLASSSVFVDSENGEDETVSAVRLMAIELDGAFVDLLNDQRKGSGDNENGRCGKNSNLDDRDLRLGKKNPGIDYQSVKEFLDPVKNAKEMKVDRSS